MKLAMNGRGPLLPQPPSATVPRAVTQSGRIKYKYSQRQKSLFSNQVKEDIRHWHCADYCTRNFPTVRLCCDATTNRGPHEEAKPQTYHTHGVWLFAFYFFCSFFFIPFSLLYFRIFPFSGYLGENLHKCSTERRQTSYTAASPRTHRAHNTPSPISSILY